MVLSSSSNRLLCVAAVLLLWAGLAFGRLAGLQLFSYRDYLGRAQRQQQRIIEVSPKRGVLYDRNLRELAMSVSVDSAFAVPSEISDPGMVAQLVSRVLNTSPEEIETRLKSSRSFAWLARKLEPQTIERLQALNLKGIYFQKENRRFYPKRELAAHVLGYVDIDEKGLGGIEYALDNDIRGRPGRILILTDARRRWFDRSERAASSGASVVLTLDEKIQFIAEKELRAAMARTHALAGTVIVQDPNTGEILALANAPTFNPNFPTASPPDNLMNRAVTALYEPGSTFKMVTIAAALEERLTRPEEVIDCQMGSIEIAGHRIRDHKPYGLLTVAGVMANSSDVGAIKLGLRLGPPRMYDYIRAFGFGVPSGIGLPGETRGILRRAENWSAISIGAVSMGQEIGITPIQLISATSVIANGGLLYRPRVIREHRRGGQIFRKPEEEPKRTISASTAATLRSLLEGVVREGTGKLARLDGYAVAGKTGTAQKIDPATGRYSPHQFIASFVGFAPLNRPALTVLVVLDSPVGPHDGGIVAAPVFRQITEQVLAYLEVPRDWAVPSRIQRASARSAVETNPEEVSDFSPVLAQEAAPASDATLESGQPATKPVEPATTVALTGTEAVTVPRLLGMSVRRASEECLRVGLAPALVGSGVAAEQQPAPGTVVRRGARVTVRFARTVLLQPAAARGN